MRPLLAGEPATVGHYRLLARLGKGSMGGVYLARSRGGRAVAVKQVRPDLAEDQEFRERFRREVAMARSVGGFWTAAVVDADTEADQPWLATEYVPGPTLHQAVADHGPLPEQTVLSLAAGLAEALTAVHKAELVHRDLKPANVLLGPDGPRVIDFGISRALTSSAMTATGMFFGTPGFFSPEQTVGEGVGPPSDVFSLGAVLVFAATGAGPFGDDHTAAMLYRVVHSEADLTHVPDGLRPILAACLTKEPEQRPTPTRILDEIGEPSPQGDNWLPPDITAVITEHTMQLQQAAAADDEPDAVGVGTVQQGPVQQGPAKQGTAQYTSSVAAAAAPVQAPPGPDDQVTRPDWSAVERREPLAPARPRDTSQQRTDRVRADVPGPVFRTKGRMRYAVGALFALFMLVAVFAFARDGAVSGQPLMLLGVAGVLFGTSAALSVARMLTPALRIKINGDGIRISRPGLAREIPWHHVNRVGVVGRGKSQSVAVWTTQGAPKLSSSWWHWVRRYHGGVRVFPVGITGGVLKRRQESRRMHTALHQYAPRAYDSRML
ncbi:protein kinase [Allosaccharopolyspora coralli]|uniref:Protein kinase n=1 Tax=Allosaccharopolyspora coralli TaxID=2665642 RepID=A0A5Q3QDH0_9PSEU|nr:serine/threonine-protein kinase [Allosaccharopolyspora coralli]QGK69535.1 protein kinase [Allosaccharopolyspora coralli]